MSRGAESPRGALSTSSQSSTDLYQLNAWLAK